jgi:hypothetical protein
MPTIVQQIPTDQRSPLNPTFSLSVLLAATFVSFSDTNILKEFSRT